MLLAKDVKLNWLVERRVDEMKCIKTDLGESIPSNNIDLYILQLK